MPATDVIFREARISDLPAIFQLRDSVTENLVTIDQLAKLGITPASVAASFQADSKGWVADQSGQILGFSIADRQTSSIFALFIKPSYDGQGLGKKLLSLATQWLWDNHAESIWLTTAPNTRAEGFYLHLGWKPTGKKPNGEIRFELHRPT